MKSVSVYCQSVNVHLDTGPDIRDITALLENMIHESKVENGGLCATMVGSTGSLTTIEYEPGVVRDLMAAVNRLAPPDLEYEHEKAWHDGNGHSHVQAALLGPSIALPIRKGRLKMGTWQQVVAINHDNRPRQRSIEITINGYHRLKIGLSGLEERLWEPLRAVLRTFRLETFSHCPAFYLKRSAPQTECWNCAECSAFSVCVEADSWPALNWSASVRLPGPIDRFRLWI